MGLATATCSAFLLSFIVLGCIALNFTGYFAYILASDMNNR